METANFLELRSRINEWNIDDEKSFLTKLTSFKDSYIQQYNSISNNLTNLSRNIDLIEIDFYNSMNSLKTISQYKLIEHIIEPDEPTSTATPNEPEPEEEQILTNEQRAALLEQATQSVIQTSIEAIPKETKQQQQQEQIEDDTVSVTSSRTLFDGVNYKKVKLPFIIETSDFKDTEFLGLAQEDVIEEKLNENGIDNQNANGVTEKEFVPVSADGEEVKFETEGLPKGSIPVPPPLQQNVPLYKQGGVKVQQGNKGKDVDNNNNDDDDNGGSGLSSMLRSQTKNNNRMSLPNHSAVNANAMQLPDSRQSLPMNMTMKQGSNVKMQKQFISPNSMMFGGGMGRSTMMNPKGGVSLGNFLSGMDGDDDEEEEEEDNDDYNQPNMNMNKQLQMQMMQRQTIQQQMQMPLQQQQPPSIQMNAPHIPVMIKPNQLPMRSQLPVRNEDEDDNDVDGNNNMKQQQQQQQQQPKLPQPKLPQSKLPSSQGGFFDMDDQQQLIQQTSKSVINPKPKVYMRAQTIQPTPESEKLLKAKKNLSSIFDDDDDDDDNDKLSSFKAKQGRETSIPVSTTTSDKFSKITAQTSSLSQKLSLITNESKQDITRNTVSNVSKKPMKSTLFNMDDDDDVGAFPKQKQDTKKVTSKPKFIDDEEEDDGSADRNPFEKRKPEVKEQIQQQPQKISMFESNKGRSTLPVKKNVFDDYEEEQPKQKTTLPKSIFDDEDEKPKTQVKKEQQQQQQQPQQQPKPQVKKDISKNLFDDDDEESSKPKIEQVKKKIEEQPKKASLPKSIFEDDEDNNNKPKPKPATSVPKTLFDDENDKPKPTTAPKKLFDNINDKPKPKPTTTVPKSIFDDDEDDKPKPKPTATVPKNLFEDIDNKPKPQITTAPKAIFDDINDKPKPKPTATVPKSIFDDNDEDNKPKPTTAPKKLFDDIDNKPQPKPTTLPKSLFDDENTEDKKLETKPKATTTTTVSKNLFDDEEDKPKLITTTQDKPHPQQTQPKNIFDVLQPKPEPKPSVVSNEQENNKLSSQTSNTQPKNEQPKPTIIQPALETSKTTSSTKKLNPFEQMLENKRQEQLKREQEREKESQLFKQSTFKERFSNMEQVSIDC